HAHYHTPLQPPKFRSTGRIAMKREFFSPRYQKHARPRSKRAHLQMERLEDRVVPATFLGVAAGDADATNAILWTRVNQTANVPVTAQVSTSPDFSGLLLQFHGATNATTDYTAKVAATQLAPGTQYYYRFVIDATSELSGTGTFKTAPAADAQVGLKFA